MPRRLTKDDFINKAKALYGDKYDYSKVKYVNSATKVCIICPEHGEFWQIPNNHIRGAKCPACSNRQRINTQVFLDRARKVHGDRYDYSKVNCKGSESFVTIICPIHGPFMQKAEYHLNGNGCPKCFGTPKSNTKEFIGKAKKIYGDKYDYSKVDYKGNKVKVIITCKKHGDWQVTPNAFLRGSECPKCYGTPKYTTEEFIKKAKTIHGDKYDYSKVNYSGNKNKVCIICPEHGEFWQTGGNHLRGAGCPICTVGYRVFKKEGNRLKIDKELFIKQSLKNHTIKYDYSKVDFNGTKEKICIICPEHGEFWQGPGYHMRGGNCPKCAGSSKLTTEDFIRKAKLVHGDKYDYSRVEYKNYTTKVCIICPEHGEFWQVPNNHLYGAGCPTCPQSNMEGELREVLKRNNIKFEQEKGFPWLRFKKKMFLDFYLPDYNVAIECQGGQHFMPVDLFGGEEFFNKTIQRDITKHDLCEKHGIKVLYYSRSGSEYIYPVVETFSDLIKQIREMKHMKKQGQMQVKY